MALIIIIYIAILMYIGMNAFNGWTYNLAFEGNTSTTTSTGYQYDNLLPNNVYIINIFPSMGKAVGNVDDGLMSSWIVQTAYDGQCVCISSSSSYYTVC